MDARRKTAIRLSEDARNGFARVAAKGSFDKKTQGQAPPFGGGGEEGQPPFPPKGGGVGGMGLGPTKRQIPEDHDFDKKAIKPIVKSLWAMSVALGHALTAHRQFSRLKSSTFSPDGLLGGRGYVMPVKEIRQQLFEACENLSALVDTLHDEINAPHWKPKLGELEKTDMAEVERLLSDAEDWVDNPEDSSDEEMVDIEGNPQWNKDRFKPSAKPGSDIPDGGDKETLHKSGPGPGSAEHPDMKHVKEASTVSYDRSSWLWQEHPLSALTLPKEASDLRALYTRFFRQANSSVDPGTLPGPRVDHLDRADVDQTGPGGSVNMDEPSQPDDWIEQDGVGTGKPMTDNTGDGYNYPSMFDGEMNNTAGSLPTRTIYNPHAVMPGDPEAPLGDRTKNDHYETVEDKTGAYDYARVAAFKLDPKELAQLKGVAHTDRHLQALANALESGNWRLADQYYQFLLARRELHAVPDGIVGELGRRNKGASSGVPDSNSDSTPTQGWDFGIGDGNGNDAHGQGAGGYGNGNPGSPDSNPDGGTGNMGVNGPRADLPNDPGGSTRDREHDDSNAIVEHGIGNNSVPHNAATELPNDDDSPVARSDYYRGDKGNDFNTDNSRSASPEAQSRTPGNDAPQPPAPVQSRPMHLYEHEFAAGIEAEGSGSEMPGDENALYDSAPGYGPDEWHRTEHGDQPYVKWDDTTHNMRPDNNTQRGDLPAPYVNQDL